MANAYVFGTRGRTPTLGCDVPPCLTASRVHRRLLPDTRGSTRPRCSVEQRLCVRRGGADRDRDRLPVPVGRGPLGQHDLPGQAAYHIMMRIIMSQVRRGLHRGHARTGTHIRSCHVGARACGDAVACVELFCGMRVGCREHHARSLRNPGIVSRVSSRFGAEY